MLINWKLMIVHINSRSLAKAKVQSLASVTHNSVIHNIMTGINEATNNVTNFTLMALSKVRTLLPLLHIMPASIFGSIISIALIASNKPNSSSCSSSPRSSSATTNKRQKK